MQYSTNFPLTENPISEGNNWINGGITGLDWFDVQTTPGFAFNTGGTQFSDATAIVKGNWKPDQQAMAKVRVVNLNVGNFQEGELRLRTSINAHSITGYEIDYRMTRGIDAGGYTAVVRWNGPNGDFTALPDIIHGNSTTYTSIDQGATDGDVIFATIVGNVISAYCNGVLQARSIDNVYTNGNPGIGFDVSTMINASDFGFSSFSATDDLSSTLGGIINADYQWLGGDR